mmetsp:Transcript_26666/g.37805  ORF Transcript_26666/g.37805 Transcript_26666/m.37805 type:complete len:597 (-) Transcript_26666:112-1902(-)|eukprot:CAMPEP_0202464700 /NCGR_PEP_ID=MMETSP1360-20130828/62781_1 /ASSEMBLY_ACC=CAM_ASM_000848 /TAXON_ID=515479 /ORGANISM="Licmophora paradoxa, Strain CCMP2313" /LENGTH=596 /DNA_ID=CAMNT_0049088115 /DNA_START=26 /DNA_END=1816 /DNA_ORIENTATION=-
MSSSLTQAQTANFTTPSAKLDEVPKVTPPPFDAKASVRSSAVSRRGGRYGAASPGRFVYTRPPPPIEHPATSLPKPEERDSKELESFQKKAAKKEEQRRNVTFSPPPPKREESEKMKKTPRTPNHSNLPFLQLHSPTFLSPKARSGTPTDFSVDFGKSPKPAAGLEASNVLAWLQSPNASNLFSPGGLGSIGGTPGRGGPRTPISSSSFFFSDVAGLPRPKRLTSMISISPLSAAKRPRYDDSPQPLAGAEESPLPSVSRERMQMQDEDLSVLLQLASHSNTPSRNGGDKQSDYRGDNNNPSLQLPMIGSADREGSGPKLLRKKGTEEYLSAFRYGDKEKENAEENKSDTYRPYQDSTFSYPPMPPGGSMSVVVGGPPPMSSKPKKSGLPIRNPSYSGSECYPYAPPQYYPYPPPSQAATAAAATASATQAGKPPAPGPKTAVAAIKKPKATTTSKPTQKTAQKRSSPSSAKRTRKITPSLKKKAATDKKTSAEKVAAVNAAGGNKNDKAAELAAAILRGVTMRPSGKWQAQLYYAGKSRYIGVFDSREKAALAYEIAREKLKSAGKASPGQSAKATEDAVNLARKAAFDGVSEKF